jgi:hypothetical protein
VIFDLLLHVTGDFGWVMEWTCCPVCGPEEWIPQAFEFAVYYEGPRP